MRFAVVFPILDQHESFPQNISRNLLHLSKQR